MAAAKRIIHNPSGYHSKGATPKDKVNNFALFIKEFGWTGRWYVDEDSEILHLRATRDDNERIDIEWPEGQWWPDVWYTFAGDTIKCRNISQAAKLAQSEPDASRIQRAGSKLRARSLGGRLLGPDSPVPTRTSDRGGSEDPSAPEGLETILGALKSYVPFDKESTAEEVLAELKRLKNPSITWVGPMTRHVHTAMIKTVNKHFSVTTNKNGQVIINFADDYGFKSVYASTIIGVT